MTTTHRELYFSIIVALLLHISFLAVFNAKFGEMVTKLPFKIVNIRLGSNLKIDGNSVNHPGNIAPLPKPAEKIWKSAEEMQKVMEQQPLQPPAKTILKSDGAAANHPVLQKNEAAIKDANIAKINAVKSPENKEDQAVAANNQKAASSEIQSGNGMESVSSGDSATPDQISTRYEQVLSLWFARLQYYPDEARQRNIEGEAVVRLQIDRDGHVLKYALEKPTGSSILDQAIFSMMSGLKSVPEVPENYPGGKIIEFLIPVRFSLH